MADTSTQPGFGPVSSDPNADMTDAANAAAGTPAPAPLSLRDQFRLYSQPSGASAPGGLSGSNVSEQINDEAAGNAESQQTNAFDTQQGTDAAAAAETQAGYTQGQDQLTAQKKQAYDQMSADENAAGAKTGAELDQARSQRSLQANLQTQQINAKAVSTLRALTAQSGQTMDSLFQNFQQSNKDLSQRKDASELEQTGFLLALSDKAYVQEVQDTGAALNLSNSIEYTSEVNRLTWGTATTQYLQQMNFANMMNTSADNVKIQIANLDADAALGLATAILQDQQAAAAFSAVPTLVGGVAKAYGSYTPSDNSQTNPDGNLVSAPSDANAPSGANQGYTDPLAGVTSAPLFPSSTSDNSQNGSN